MNEQRKKSSLLLPAVLILAFLVFLLLARFCAEPAALAAGSRSEYRNIDTNEKRLALIASFGRECEEKPAEVVEVTVPREFDSVYEAYNELQKPLGLDLSDFRGKTLRRYTYVLKNHSDAGTVYVNLLFSVDTFVGGDVSSADPRGFTECLKASV